MRSALLIAQKDFIQAVRNRSFFVLGILAPLAIMTVMDLTMGDALSGSFNPVIHIVDPSSTSDELVAGLRESGFNNVELSESAEAARSAVDDGDAAAAIIFPPELIQVFQDPGQGAEIEVVTKPDAEVSAAISRSIAESTAIRYRTLRASMAVAAQAGQPPTGEVPAVDPVVTVSGVEAGTRILSDATYFAVGMAAFFVFFTAQTGMTTLHNERRDATLARMLASPSPRWAPLAGKALASLAIGLTAFLVLWGLSTLLLGADWGPPLGVLAVALAAMFTAVGLGAMASALTSTSEAAGALSGVITTALAFFGGTFVQVPATGLLASLSRLSPFRWIMDGIGQNAGVGTTTDVLISAAVLSLFGLVAGAIAFSRRNQLLGGA
jgi:ABC-2 type transport system permease protein